jgi:hypothetical protein
MVFVDPHACLHTDNAALCKGAGHVYILELDGKAEIQTNRRHERVVSRVRLDAARL